MKVSVFTSRRIAAISVVVAIAALLPAAVADAAAPAPVTDLHAYALVPEGPLNFEFRWTPSPDTDLAEVCYLVGTTAPVSPADAGVRCMPPTQYGDDYFRGTAVNTTYAISVFAVDRTTQETSAPTSTTITTGDFPPMWPYDFQTRVIDAHGLRLTWRGNEGDGDHPAQTTVAWVITVARGTSPAPVGSLPTAERPGAIEGNVYVATGLEPGQPYTFTVQGRNARGDLSIPIWWTAATRVVGVRVRDTSTSSAPVLPATRGSRVQAAADLTAGVARVAFTDGGGKHVYYARRSTTSGWSTPVRIAGSKVGGLGDPKLAVSPRGAVAVAWLARGKVVYRTRPAASSRWNPPHVAVVGAAVSDLPGLVIDRHGRMHFLVRLKFNQFGYVTNASGHWTVRVIDGTNDDPRRDAALALDVVTDRVIVVDVLRQSGSELVRVARASDTSTHPGRWHVWATYRPWVVVATTATAAGGVITLGLSTTVVPATPGSPPVARVFVVHGSSPSSHGRITRVAGSNTDATNLIVKAASAKNVALAWSSTSPTWTPAGMGVFVSRRSRGASGWTSGVRHQMIASQYDYPLAVACGSGSHLLAAFDAI